MPTSSRVYYEQLLTWCEASLLHSLRRIDADALNSKIEVRSNDKYGDNLRDHIINVNTIQT
jgi:hypothetical protein